MKNVKEIKSVLAKLLATENLSVEFANVETASFDVEKRILRIPTMKEIDPTILDLFVGHEVSHALYTPMSGLDRLKEKPENFHSFVNVVEDVRIERLIQKKYPGLKKPFYNAYAKLKADDFFKINNKNTDSLLFIDRMNLKAKLGTQVDINFNDIEQDFMTRSQNTETFDEVFKLSEEIYEYCEQELEDKKKENPDDMQQYTADMSQEGVSDNQQSPAPTPQSNENQEETGDGQSSGSDEQEDENGEDKGQSQGQQETDGEGNKSDIPDTVKDMTGKAQDEKGMKPGAKSITDLNSQKSQKDLQTSSATEQVRYFDIPKHVDLDKFIVPFDAIKKELFEYWSSYNPKETLAKNTKKFKKDNEKIINYLHKEFEMKKQADRYARATIARTGVLNVNKLHSYKYNDDLFLKKNIIPNGKDHGMVFFLDWSGSMADNMHGTMQQLNNLALFCKKAQIPFAAYAFSSEYFKREFGRDGVPSAQSHNMHEAHIGNCALLQLFHEKMSTTEFNEAVGIVEAMGSMYDRQSRGDYAYWGLPRNFYLGGTPLNHAIILAHKLVKQFQTKNNVQIMSTSFLTDGSSHSVDGVAGYNSANQFITDDSEYRYCGRLILRDGHNQVQITNNRVRPSGDFVYSIENSDITAALYKLLKMSTGANTTGFFVAGRQEVRYAYSHYFWTPGDLKAQTFEEWKKELTKQNAMTSYTSGLDELYVIKGGKSLNVVDEGLTDELNGASKQKLTTAFKKMGRGKLKNRVILQKFIEKVA